MNKAVIFLIVGMIFSGISKADSGIVFLDSHQRQNYRMPFVDKMDVINFLLHQEEIKAKIRKSGKWWIKAEKESSAYGDVWNVVLGNGDGECASAYQCTMTISDEGVTMLGLECMDDWSCE